MSPRFLLAPACAGLTLMASGCSSDTLHRLGYAAVQSAGQQRCLVYSPANESISCLDNVSYDEYQRQRREVASAR
jgi:hypothetical protein